MRTFLKNVKKDHSNAMTNSNIDEFLFFRSSQFSLKRLELTKRLANLKTKLQHLLWSEPSGVSASEFILQIIEFWD